ncbi:MAG: hypothetical protein V3S24_24235 [Candidatus Tectomicrobia bacterium]
MLLRRFLLTSRVLGLGDRAIDINRGVLAKGPWLLVPQLRTHRARGLLELDDGRFVKPAQKITGGRRRRYPTDGEGIEVGFVSAQAIERVLPPVSML